MAKQITFVLDNQELVDLIESLHYEVEARKDIITFYLTNAMDTNTDSFKNYNKEYREFFVQYSTAKEILEKDFIVPKVDGAKYSRWNLDFQSKEVTVDLV